MKRKFCTPNLKLKVQNLICHRRHDETMELFCEVNQLCIIKYIKYSNRHYHQGLPSRLASKKGVKLTRYFHYREMGDQRKTMNFMHHMSHVCHKMLFYLLLFFLTSIGNLQKVIWGVPLKTISLAFQTNLRSNFFCLKNKLYPGSGTTPNRTVDNLLWQ